MNIATLSKLPDIPKFNESPDKLRRYVPSLAAFLKEVPWLVMQWASFFYRHGGIVELRKFSEILKRQGVTRYSPSTLRCYAHAWDKYSHLRKKFPLVTPAYYAVLYNIGVKPNKAEKVLADIEKRKLTCKQVEEKYGKK